MRAHSAGLHLLLVATICVSGLRTAQAVICPPGVQFFHYVGDNNPASPSYDSKCTNGSIQDAIDHTFCPATTIVVTHEIGSSGLHLTISDKTFTLVGEAAGAGCGSLGTTGATAASPTTPQLRLSGAGNGGHSVIDVGGNSNVTLQYVEITGGNPGSGGYGGGIDFNGTGSLTLDTDTIDNNNAGFGAGITVNGNGGAATLTLKNYTQVLNNTAAHDGGGVRIEGDARLFMLETASTISFNHADNGFGGGIEILGPARVDIASSGVVFAGAISDNTAANGGGVAVIATSAGDAVARVFTTDPTQPVLVSQNTASSSGGAFYLRPRGPYFGPIQSANLCAWEFRIDNNNAAAGAAVYNAISPDDDATVADSVYINPVGNCGPESPSSLGAVACAPGTPCNEVSDNSAVDGQGHATAGSVIELNSFDTLSADRFAMRGNSAARMITANNTFEVNRVSHCLIADNHSAHELLHSEPDTQISGSGPFTVDSCTIAQNTIDNGYVFYATQGFILTNSIVYAPGAATIDYGHGCCLDAGYTLSTEVATFPADAAFITLNNAPLFGDAANLDIGKRDYHLRAFVQSGAVTASPAIDYAPPGPGDDRDLDDNASNQDVPAVTDYQGDRDLGCYEAQPILDRVFGDAFGDALSLVH